MKKLLFGALVILAMASCEPKKGPANASATKDTITLDGIDSASFIKMFSNFYYNPGIHKGMTSVWFCKEYIDSLSALLANEGADGVRVYFTRADSGKNSIALVSTKAFGTNPDVVAGTFHKDYFTHSAAFLHSDIAKGRPSYDNDHGGARLYTENYQCDKKDGCDTTQPHYISCNLAKKMVNSFGDSITPLPEWFNRSLIDSIKRELRDGKGDGVRIYYAKRINLGGNVHGFVFVTTRLGKDGVHTDYFECTPAKPVTNNKHAIETNLHRVAANAHAIGSRLMAPIIYRVEDSQDNGEQCNPSCNGSAVPAPPSTAPAVNHTQGTGKH
jgi:hypothetical protein